MKTWIIGIMLAVGVSVMAGSIGLPREAIKLPQVANASSHLVCVWDEAAGNWIQEHVAYDNSGLFELQIQERGDLNDGGWYWVGLWDTSAHRYVFGKWVGHFK